MQAPKFSHATASLISLVLFALVLAFGFVINHGWTVSLLALGIAISSRQFFLGQLIDSTLTIGVFLVLFITYQFHLFWDVLVPAPTLLAALGLFLLLKECTTVYKEYQHSKNKHGQK